MALYVLCVGLRSKAPRCFTASCLPQDAGSQQVGFLLGSCGVALALTTDACQKGLPKAQSGEVAAFKGALPRPRQSASLLGCVLRSLLSVQPHCRGCRAFSSRQV